MQIVDYYCGVPLCGLLSLVDSLLPKPMKLNPPHKVLLIELSEMGSAILAHQAIEEAIELVGSADNVYFLIFERNVESVELLNQIPAENIRTIRCTDFLSFTFSTLAALRWVHKRKIDSVIDLELFSRFTSIFSFLCFAKNRVGFHNYTEEGLYRGSFLTHRVWYNPRFHIAQNFLCLVRALKDEQQQPMLKAPAPEADQELPECSFVPDELANIRSELAKLDVPAKAPLVLFNPDPGELFLRGWPLEYYRKLAEILLKEHPECFIVFCGLKSSRSYFEAIQSELNSSRIVDFTGQTETMRELLALFVQSHCLVTADSGPAHFASLTRTPTVVLFGPETPDRYRPISNRLRIHYETLACSPCYSAANHRNSCCTDNKCMQAIKPSDVAKSVFELLEG